jgi:hypothetical protein
MLLFLGFSSLFGQILKGCASQLRTENKDQGTCQGRSGGTQQQLLKPAAGKQPIYPKLASVPEVCPANISRVQPEV